MQITLTKDQQLCLSEDRYQMIVPATVVGLRFIISTLKGREQGKTKLAQPGAPTQWEIDQAVKAWQAANPPKPKGKKIEHLIEIELDL